MQSSTAHSAAMLIDSAARLNNSAFDSTAGLCCFSKCKDETVTSFQKGLNSQLIASIRFYVLTIAVSTTSNTLNFNKILIPQIHKP